MPYKRRTKTAIAQDWFATVFIPKLAPIYFPEEKQPVESFDTVHLELGEYNIDGDANSVFLTFATTPHNFEKLNQGLNTNYDEVLRPFSEAAYASGFGEVEILTDEENSTLTFSIATK